MKYIKYFILNVGNPGQKGAEGKVGPKGNIGATGTIKSKTRLTMEIYELSRTSKIKVT